MTEVVVADREDRAFYSPAGLVRKLAISPSTLNKLIEDGEIAPYWVETQRRISPDEVDRFLGEPIDHHDPRPCHSPASLAKLLGVHRDTVYTMLHTGRLRSFKVGGQRRFTAAHIDTYLHLRRLEGKQERGFAR